MTSVPKPKSKKKEKANKKKLLKQLDDLARKCTFLRDKYTCIHCGKQPPQVIISWSHIITRSSQKIRWLPENNITFCKACHQMWWHNEPALSGSWFAKVYPKRLEEINRIRNNGVPFKRSIKTYEAIKDMLELLLEKLEAENGRA